MDERIDKSAAGAAARVRIILTGTRSGATKSTNFPTVNPLQATNRGGFDGFVAKLNAAGSALVYSSYLGGSGDEAVAGVAVDGLRNAYLYGLTGSSNFPTANPLQAAKAGGLDAWIAKMADLARARSASPSGDFPGPMCANTLTRSFNQATSSGLTDDR